MVFATKTDKRNLILDIHMVQGEMHLLNKWSTDLHKHLGEGQVRTHIQVNKK